MHCSVLSWRLMVILCRFLRFSLWSSFFYRALLCELELPSLRYSQLCCFHPRLLLLLPPYAQADNCAATNQDNQRAHPICSTSLKDNSPPLLEVWCLENHCFVYFTWFLSCFRRKGKSGLCCSILAKGRGQDKKCKGNIESMIISLHDIHFNLQGH